MRIVLDSCAYTLTSRVGGHSIELCPSYLLWCDSPARTATVLRSGQPQAEDDWAFLSGLWPDSARYRPGD